MVGLQDSFQRILSKYEDARRQRLADHELAQFIRTTVPAALALVVDQPDRYRIEGSHGKGN